MGIDRKYVGLINADIDGELSEEQRADLDEFLNESAEGRALHDELSGLCQTISASKPLHPPPHLKHVILESARRMRRRRTPAEKLIAVVSLPALRYAGAFAAGGLLAFAFIGSDQASRHAFDDMTDLVGTISEDAPQPNIADRSMRLTKNEIAGIVSLSNAGEILILDFDIVSHEPVRIVADFSNRDIWFNGFAQLENAGTSVLAETGQVTLQAEGRRRYAMYLHNTGGNDTTIDLRFYVGDTLIQEGELHFIGGYRGPVRKN